MIFKKKKQQITLQNNNSQSELSQVNFSDDFSKFAVFIGVIIGLIMNWLALYLNIILGLISIGISGFVVLLITKIFLRQKATQSNLALVSIAYGATSAAEASVGLLFLIWLYNNISSFGLTFNAPSWLLPSREILTDRIIFSVEWIPPLITHYFLMFIPGVTGLILGIYLAPRFINNEKEYPFPGTIRRSKELEVLVTNQKSKIQLFIRFLLIGFIIAFITLFYPAIDISNIDKGVVIGLMLGTVGVTMFAVGFIINNPKITIPAGFASIFIYAILNPIIFDSQDFQMKVSLGSFQNNYFDLYSYLLQDVYISFFIGFILSAAIFSPLIWSIIKKLGKKFHILRKSQVKDLSSENTKTKQSMEDSTDDKGVNEFLKPTSIRERTPRNSILFRTLKIFKSFGKKELIISLTYIIALILSTIFVINLELLPQGTNLAVIFILLFWILFLGSLIQGYIVVSTVAKTSTAVAPPFIFDMIPLFLVGARGVTPYVATPKGEIGETFSIASTLKFAQQMKINTKNTLIAYFAGYFTAAISTPFFALFLWRTLGIGTASFPAPGFPIMLAMFGPFAAGTIEAFLNISELLLGVVAALFCPSIGISVAIGMFIPPHMALTLTLGGVTALIFQKHYGKGWMEDRGKIVATAISVGATLTVPILVFLKSLAI